MKLVEEKMAVHIKVNIQFKYPCLKKNFNW